VQVTILHLNLKSYSISHASRREEKRKEIETKKYFKYLKIILSRVVVNRLGGSLPNEGRVRTVTA
jgi:hypothetical protein